jgi:hypothetical protein
MTEIPPRVNLLLPMTIWLNCATNCQFKLATKIVSDGECFVMKSCWFEDVKHNMKARGINIGGGWGLDTRCSLAVKGAREGT